MTTTIAPPNSSPSLNFSLDIQLADDLEFLSPVADNILSPQGIFLTGATGFLGVYLLEKLLKSTEATLYCLVRSSDRKSALQRLEKQVDFYQISLADHWHRVVPIAGDLGQPNFGLTESEFTQLANTIQVIYHNGSLVNSALDYGALRSPNVLGTLDILRLAGTGTYTKPVHYVSSLAVFLSPSFVRAERIYETDHPSDRLKGGYKQSKWVAEQLIQRSHQRGLPTAIYRLGRIMGHSTTGINGNLGDFLCSLIKGCIRLGQFPQSDAPINLMSVDYVGEALASISQSIATQSHWGNAFHLLNPNPIPWDQICQTLQALGYHLEGVDRQTWLQTLQAAVGANPEDSLLASLLLLMGAPVNLLTPKAPMDGSLALQHLAKSGVICPAIDRPLLDRYIRYFQTIGYLPTPSQQAQDLQTVQASPQPDPAPDAPKAAPTSFWKSIRSNRRSHQDAFDIRPLDRDRPLPLSFGQERLWQVEQLHTSTAVHNLRAVFRLTGPLNSQVLHRSIQAIVDRHDILRTRFPAVNGEPVAVVEPQYAIELPIVDLTHLNPEAQAQEVSNLARTAVQTPFNLEQLPLIRYQLLILGPNDHVLLRTVHHIVNDVWTDTVRLRELAQLYSAFLAEKPSPLPDLDIQYGDFAAAQRQWLQGQVLQQELNHWRNQLQGASLPLRLPTDYQLTKSPSYRGSALVITLPESLSDRLKTLAGQRGVSLFVLLLGAFQTLLYCYSGQTDLTLCSPVAGRKQAATKRLIGYFSNIVLLRTQLDPQDSFCGVIKSASDTSLSAFDHGDLPVQTIVETLGLPSGLLSRAMFTLQNVPKQPPQLAPDLAIRLQEMEEGTSNFDLSLSMKEKDATLLGVFRYKTDLFKPETIAHMADNFQNLLDILVTYPDRPLTALPQFGDHTAPMPTSEAQAPLSPDEAPQGDLELLLANLWRSVLRVDHPISRTISFFELGGRSLAMAQIYSQLCQTLGSTLAAEIQVLDLFEHPTIAQMANYLNHLQSQS